MSRYVELLVIALSLMILSLPGLTESTPHVGGGDQNPSLETNAKTLAKWQDAKIGLTVHWGPVALRGTDIGWSRSEQVPQPDYDSLYKEFNPLLFGSGQWVQLRSE